MDTNPGQFPNHVLSIRTNDLKSPGEKAVANHLGDFKKVHNLSRCLFLSLKRERRRPLSTPAEAGQRGWKEKVGVCAQSAPPSVLGGGQHPALSPVGGPSPVQHRSASGKPLAHKDKPHSPYQLQTSSKGKLWSLSSIRSSQVIQNSDNSMG